jgi:hypothetical protein
MNNIKNLTLADSYELFGLDINSTLSKHDINSIKKSLIQLHPDMVDYDTSDIDMNIVRSNYIYYREAFNHIKNMFLKEQKIKEAKETSEYNSFAVNSKIDQRSNNSNEPDNLGHLRQNGKTDMGKFNDIFESNKQKSYVNDGYDDWSSTHIKNAPEKPTATNKSDMNAIFSKMRAKAAASELVEYKGVSVPTMDNGILIDGSSANTFTSGLFSNSGLEFQDLKQAYSNTIMSVSEDQLNDRMSYRSISEYKTHGKKILHPPNSK